MEPISIFKIIESLGGFGLGGLVFIVWYYERKKSDCLKKLLENSQKLTEQYGYLAKDLKEIIILNTQAITRLEERLPRRRKAA